MQSVCVFCGSSVGFDPRYGQAARDLGRYLANREITLVYGGAKVGIMGELADAVLNHEGRVVGVIPEFLCKKEVRHTGLTELITVESMHQRKSKMAELSQGFIALPGGLGTLEELCEILTWSQLGLVPNPVGILNVMGYFDQLLGLFDHMVKQGFLREENRQTVLSADEPGQLLDQMDAFEPLVMPKWLDAART